MYIEGFVLGRTRKSDFRHFVHPSPKFYKVIKMRNLALVFDPVVLVLKGCSYLKSKTNSGTPITLPHRVRILFLTKMAISTCTYDLSQPNNRMLHANFIGLCFIEPELLPMDVLHCGNRDFKPFLLL